MIYAELETATGEWTGCDFLLDTGGDVTVLSFEVLQRLGRPTAVAAHQLGGIGGAVPTLEVWTTIRFISPDGSQANIGGARSAFGVAGEANVCILGLDLLRAFTLIADRPGNTVCLMRPPHRYTIHTV
jgi:hypothetical protein